MAKTKLAPRPRRKKPAHVARSKPKTSQTHSEATTTAAEKPEPTANGPYLFSPTIRVSSREELARLEAFWAEEFGSHSAPTPEQPIDPATGLPYPDPLWHYLTPKGLHTFLDEIENDLECARDDICESGHGDQGWQEHAMRGLSRLRNAMLSLEDLRSRVEREADEVAK